MEPSEMIEKIRYVDALTELMWAHQENLIERVLDLERQVEALQVRVKLLEAKGRPRA